MLGRFIDLRLHQFIAVGVLDEQLGDGRVMQTCRVASARGYLRRRHICTDIGDARLNEWNTLLEPKVFCVFGDVSHEVDKL